MKELLKLKNNDYQTRKGDYPKSNIPDSIDVNITKKSTIVEFTFKNTTENDAINWYDKSKEYKTIQNYSKDYDIQITTEQDGDYPDDWVLLSISLIKKVITKVSSSTKKVKDTKTSNTGYSYCYILSTKEQRELIDLTKHKTKLQKIIKDFFGDKLESVEFTKESYTLKLKDEFLIANRRRLGRLISDGSNLKQYVRTVSYNGGQDKSGQLFRIKKEV
ncbi:MAG: hypothetical protein DRG78_06620 [Epsilonproteobacteria bacterium]|nr:MAG: hypothetical protein DRG78_06620 [Campylobacterota bacterium]